MSSSHSYLSRRLPHRGFRLADLPATAPFSAFHPSRSLLALARSACFHTLARMHAASVYRPCAFHPSRTSARSLLARMLYPSAGQPHVLFARALLAWMLPGSRMCSPPLALFSHGCSTRLPGSRIVPSFHPARRSCRSSRMDALPHYRPAACAFHPSRSLFAWMLYSSAGQPHCAFLPSRPPLLSLVPHGCSTRLPGSRMCSPPLALISHGCSTHLPGSRMCSPLALISHGCCRAAACAFHPSRALLAWMLDPSTGQPHAPVYLASLMTWRGMCVS